MYSEEEAHPHPHPVSSRTFLHTCNKNEMYVFFLLFLIKFFMFLYHSLLLSAIHPSTNLSYIHVERRDYCGFTKFFWKLLCTTAPMFNGGNCSSFIIDNDTETEIKKFNYVFLYLSWISFAELRKNFLAFVIIRWMSYSLINSIWNGCTIAFTWLEICVYGRVYVV